MAIVFGWLRPAAADVATGPSDFAFEEYEVVLDSAKRQTVVTGFLLGGPTAELAAISVEADGTRRLAVYAFDGSGWTRELETKLSPGALFVDVARIGGRDRLLVYEPGRLNWLDPETATERLLVKVAMRYNAGADGLAYGGAETTGPSDEGEIARVDVTRDLNRDGRDDLVIPDVDGFWIATQASDGSFSELTKLGPAEPFRDRVGFGEARSYGEVGITPLTAPWYLSRVHEMDFDRDGRTDLVFWNEGRFDVHRQREDGSFEPAAASFVTDVPFDSDGAYSLWFGFEERSTFSLALGLGKSIERTALHSLRDMNGDEVADLVTVTLSGRSLLRQRTRYEVHYGEPTPEGVSFSSSSSAIRPRAKAPIGYAQQWLEDLDDDGQVDAVCGHVKTGITGMMRALIGRSVALGLEVYRSEDGAYADKATTRRKVKTDFKVTGGRDAGFFPAVLVGDVNGDGLADVVFGKNRETLHVFLGVAGDELFAPEPREVSVAVPGDERNSWLVDLNRDGAQDVLMHHPSASAPHRVTLLIGR